jgi:hypothetical protein
MAFKSTLSVDELGGGYWLLKEDLRYEGKFECFIVPAGFRTNFASVPRIFTWLVPTSGEYTKAAVLHDWLWGLPGFPRRDADGIFRRTMRELGVSDLRRYVMWAAVRLGGGLRGLNAGELLVILALAVLVLPVAIPATLLVIVGLSVMWTMEVVIWALRSAVGKRVTKPKTFWWT